MAGHLGTKPKLSLEQQLLNMQTTFAKDGPLLRGLYELAARNAKLKFDAYQKEGFSRTEAIVLVTTYKP